MLELFERVYISGEKASYEELNILYQWLRDNSFPCCCLPQDYLNLIKESNGGDFMNGEREYQFLSTDRIIEYYHAYMFQLFMPYAFPFAMDGCGNFYIFNLRENDECVYAVSAGDMGWEEDECVKIAGNFMECLKQELPIDEYF